MKHFLTCVILASLVLLIPSICLASENFSGRVVGVSDGDTITVLTSDKRQVKVRLSQIDAPEKDQPYGQRAKESLSNMVFGAVVDVSTEVQDKYGRTIGRVTIDGLDVNLQLVKGGLAWAYRDYLKDQTFIDAEASAKQGKIGLWGLQPDQIVAPWIWRRGVETPRENPKVKVIPSKGAYVCGTKRYCREMASCAEARFYLNDCGLARLDGDNDGTPCEGICR